MPMVCGRELLIFSAVLCLSSGPQSPGIRSGLMEKKGAILL
jgi:hypothetical protein